MTLLTKPQGRVPLGWVLINGQRLPVVIDVEYDRFLSTLTERAGGVDGLSTSDVDAGSYAALQPPVQDGGFADTLQTLSFEFSAADMLQPTFVLGDTAGEVSMPDNAAIGAAYEVMQFDCMQLSDVLPMQE